jgi:hypothetical protein
MGGTGSTRERDDKCRQYFGWKNLKGRDHLEDQGVDGNIILEWVVRKYDGKLGTVCIWLSTRTGGVLL